MLESTNEKSKITLLKIVSKNIEDSMELLGISLVKEI
ncbi:hypothetical protein DD924_02445 [Staphylococcus pseudintermedius]|uniref:DALR anticodon binding domain-containing protein n=1 Tax=Staphylococcus pseudintermedius TaxID=283734 RepID=A0A317ZC48_STAPS|nr:hypothetical protein DD924_02445 [Staphylococcus pseudintermedius]